MNDSSNDSESKSTTDQWAAFQKIWTDTFTKMMQAGMTFSPDSAPPEFMRQFRSGIFQALAKSWEEFLRSPHFLEATKQWMDNAIAFRKLSNDFLTKVRHETQATAREDVDSIMLAVRHLETRVLDRVEELASEVQALNERLDSLSGGKKGQESGRTRSPSKSKRHR